MTPDELRARGHGVAAHRMHCAYDAGITPAQKEVHMNMVLPSLASVAPSAPARLPSTFPSQSLRAFAYRACFLGVDCLLAYLLLGKP
ncbi:MAG: hypothetical protein ABW252_06025 [Polyangiales bacterium]